MTITAYTLSYDFIAYQTANPADPLPAAQLEIQFTALKTTTDELKTAVDNLGDFDGLTALSPSDGDMIVYDTNAWVLINAGTDDYVLRMVSGTPTWSADTGGASAQAQGDVLDDLNTLGAATADGQIIVATAAGAFAYESGATLRSSIGVGTGDSPQFTGIELGHATDTTLTRTGAGDIAIEGNVVYRASGTDVPIADGGTGASTEAGARTNLGLGTAAVAALLDEDDMSSDSATGVPSQQSVKAYVDANAGGVIDLSAPMEAATTYDSSNTWTKSTDLPAGCNLMMVELWGGGGSGKRHTSNAANAGGGGGGGYSRYFVDPDNCGATETITIGAGGAAQTTDITNGNDGGDTSFGTLFARGGGGGSDMSGNKGGPVTNLVLFPDNSNADTDSGTQGAELHDDYEHLAVFEKGGRGGDTGKTGSNRRFAGAGGGGADGPTSGGTSDEGGNGSAGVNSGASSAGTQPGGGSGGSSGTGSGAGGDGRVKISYFQV